jgi:transposase
MAGDLTDHEWKLLERLIPPGKAGGASGTVAMRNVVYGVV